MGLITVMVQGRASNVSERIGEIACFPVSEVVLSIVESRKLKVTKDILFRAKIRVLVGG